VVGIANNVNINITISNKKTGKRRSDKLILGCDRSRKYEVETSTITPTKKLQKQTCSVVAKSTLNKNCGISTQYNAIELYA
jgi:hypothetical protein